MPDDDPAGDASASGIARVRCTRAISVAMSLRRRVEFVRLALTLGPGPLGFPASLGAQAFSPPRVVQNPVRVGRGLAADGLRASRWAAAIWSATFCTQVVRALLGIAKPLLRLGKRSASALLYRRHMRTLSASALALSRIQLGFFRGIRFRLLALGNGLGALFLGRFDKRVDALARRP
ncbi:hypothetical protein ACU686_39930 [Yinghuangia aomiensis]